MDGIKCVLLDIEGTICPISFVKEILFPYALKALPGVLASKWDDEDFRPYRDAFPEMVRASPGALQAHVEDLTRRDVKIASLKNLQGCLWENGYKTGAYSTPLFLDVTPRLKFWKEAGLQLAIYSSGSVFAQKLLFGHVKSEQPVAGQKRNRSDDTDKTGEAASEPPAKKRLAPSQSKALSKPSFSAAALTNGEAIEVDETAPTTDEERSDAVTDAEIETEDLQYLICEWFDTTNAGPKTEMGSYEKIADTLKVASNEIIFLSDNVKEVDAAVAAGMQSLVVDRPGNAPLSAAERSRSSIVTSLDEISLARDEASLEVEDHPSSEDMPKTSGRAVAEDGAII